MSSKNRPAARKEGIVVQEINGEVLIYDLNKNKAFCLNETSALVWEACDGNKSVADISKAIGNKLNAPANEDLVWLALDQLKKENLLSNSEEIVPEFNGMNRREVIKKVGLGTMIALPVISSLVAPTPVMAQSCVNPGGAPNGTALAGPRTTLPGDQCGGGLNSVRDAACDADRGDDCCSGNAQVISGSCNFAAAANESRFECRCIA